MTAKTYTRDGHEVRIHDGTAGSVLFLDTSGQLTEDNTNLSYNDTTNILTATANLNQATAPAGFNNIAPATATSGTDTAFATGSQFVSSVFVPVNKSITGIGYLIGSVGGTDKVYAVLYDAAGAVLANSDLTGGGATVGTAANSQTLALTATYAAKAPAVFYVGIQANGATAKIRTVPAFCGAGTYAGTVSQTHGTVVAITPPTSFTAAQGGFVFVY